MEINLINIKRMFNYILLNISEEKITMKYYRKQYEMQSHECNSYGCIIGHCLILDDWKNIPKLINNDNDIDFGKWSEQFTGIDYYCNEWLWCFGLLWQDSKSQSLLRLKYFIDNQKTPDGWNCDYDYLLPVTDLKPYNIMGNYNIKEMNSQQVFDIVTEHLLTQNQKSINRFGMCSYRNGDLKCAAGIFIPDNEYKDTLENLTWKDLVSRGKVPNNHEELIQSLQNIHDECCVSDWIEELKILAKKFNLYYDDKFKKFEKNI